MAGKFMYGVGRAKFGDKTLGYIAKGSFQLNGSKGENVKIEAEQVPGAPVLIIPQSNGSIAPTLGLIEWDYEVMASIMGGTVITDADGKAIGWKAPASIVEARGPFIIETMSKKRISIFESLLQSNLNGNLDLTSVAQIDVAVEVQMPLDGSEPFDITDITDAEWAQIMAEEAAKRRAAPVPPPDPDPEV
jgi:hypothetical protein